MLSVTEVVFIGLGSGLLAFMLIPCCAYWLNLYDVTLFCRSDQPIHTQTQIQSQTQSQIHVHHIQRHGPAII
jgi:hypothetical protein